MTPEEYADIDETIKNLRIRAEIRKKIRAEGDRIADICEKAANYLENLLEENKGYQNELDDLYRQIAYE